MDFHILPESLLKGTHTHVVGDIMGTLGMILVVAAYFALEIGFFTRLQLRYYLFNLAGALLLLGSLLIHFNLGSFIIELFWIAISVMGIIRCLRNKRQHRQTW